MAKTDIADQVAALPEPGAAAGAVADDATIPPSPAPGRLESAWLRLTTALGWYAGSLELEERRLLLRLDLSILIFGCLSFFTKYLDQASITNAYVSGMKEDLHLHGSQLNYITATFWSSYCVAMIPACYYLTHFPANRVLPALELGWGLSTFGLAWAQNVQTVYAMRFFTGLFQCCSFTGTIYVLGSWLRPSELGRRVSLFYVSAPLGTMFAGYLQAAAYTNLDGAHGLAGWRYLFIVDAVITIPIALLGFFVFPDIPSRQRPRFVTAAQQALAVRRLRGIVQPPPLRLSLDIVWRVLGRWHFYLFVLLWSLANQTDQASGSAMALYLKAHADIYSVVRINELPTGVTAISVVAAFACGVVGDWCRGRFWIPALAATLPVLVGIAMLVAYNVGEGGRLAAFFLTGFNGGVFPMAMSWASVAMANDPEERAVVTASMNAIGQGIVAGTQIVQYPASGAPNFHAGWSSSLGTCVAQLAVILVILYASRTWIGPRTTNVSRDDTEEDVEGRGQSEKC